MVAELAELARRKRKRLTVVFDGPPPAGRPKVQPLGDLTVVWAAPRTADEEILRRIQEARDPRGVTVVTDDRALTAAVSAAGARTVPLDTWRPDATRRLDRAAAEPRKPENPANVRDWERWFGDPRNRLGS